MPVLATPKIYHIVHFDCLASISEGGYLWCNAKTKLRPQVCTAIGMNSIKQRRLNKTLHSYPELCVGDCVPFYFCPRSVMLYMIYKRNHPELAFRGGQGPIVHLEADLRKVVAWANRNRRRWAFTLSNAGSNYFEDRCDLVHLEEIDWDAVGAKHWSGYGTTHDGMRSARSS